MVINKTTILFALNPELAEFLTFGKLAAGEDEAELIGAEEGDDDDDDEAASVDELVDEESFLLPTLKVKVV